MADFSRKRRVVDKATSETLPDMGAADEVVSDDGGDVLFWGFHIGSYKNGSGPILDTSVQACRGGDSRGLFAS